MMLTHLRSPTKRHVDTRRLMVSMTVPKRTLLVKEIGRFLQKNAFTIQEIASLYGMLTDAARVCRWAWPRFFSLRNAINTAVKARHAKAQGYVKRKGYAERLATELPADLAFRIRGLVAQHIAAYVWRSRITIPLTKAIRDELEYLHVYLGNPDNPWERSIGHIISRDASGTSAGDASHVGAGAFNDTMKFIIDCYYTPDLRRRIKIINTAHPDFIHINATEFLVLILQVAAIIAKLEESPPGFYPPLLVYQILTDNTATLSWCKRVQSSSPRGQALLRVLSELFRRTDLGVNCDHIAGVDNDLPDFISRLPPYLPPHERREQILRKEPALISWDCFLPSPEFLSLLSSQLSVDVPTHTPELPHRLGHFSPIASTTSCSFTL